MTNYLRCLMLVVALFFASPKVTPSVARAEGNDGGPQGQHDKTTPLANGLTADTSAQFGRGGLQVITNVQIPVPGVFESRSNGTTNTQGSSGRTAPGSRTSASSLPSIVPGNENASPTPPCCANWFVGGGPISYETGPGGTQNQFGGGALGGFDFVNLTPGIAVPGGRTTPWRVIGQVVRLDPRALALQVENDLGFPPIALKANPDPGLAQLESWFWVQNYGGETRTKSGSQSETHTECRLNDGNLECRPVTNSITVEVRETPTGYMWDFGDNRTAQDGHPAAFSTNQGLGRAYTDPYTPSWVQHKYVLSSLKFFDAGGYPISLHITWAAAFRVNGGGWQDLGAVTGSFESRHQVRESWPVGVNTTTTTTTTISTHVGP